jgi:hypothetical protein
MAKQSFYGGVPIMFRVVINGVQTRWWTVGWLLKKVMNTTKAWPYVAVVYCENQGFLKVLDNKGHYTFQTGLKSITQFNTEYEALQWVMDWNFMDRYHVSILLKRIDWYEDKDEKSWWDWV